MDYSRFVTSKPINRQAALAVSAKGIHWTPNLKPAPHVARHEAPPICKPVEHLRADQRELLGLKFGKFTVVGALGKRNKKQKSMYLVRCVCGSYEERASRAIRSTANSFDACRECRHLSNLKRQKKRERSA